MLSSLGSTLVLIAANSGVGSALKSVKPIDEASSVAEGLRRLMLMSTVSLFGDKVELVWSS